MITFNSKIPTTPRLLLAAALVIAFIFQFSGQFSGQLSGRTALAASPEQTAESREGLAADMLASGPATEQIREATVNLYCRMKYGNKTFSTSGSGVFIDDRGVILTNAHVAQYFLVAGETRRPTSSRRVQADCSVRTGSPAKETYKASVLYLPEIWLADGGPDSKRGTGENDFALLLVTGSEDDDSSAKFPALPIDIYKIAAKNESVTLAGYPAEGLSFRQIKNELAPIAVAADIKNVQGFEDQALSDLLTLTPTGAGSSGISGGPVVDESGTVIGIAVAKNSNGAVRALSLAYINRAVQAQTFLPLNFLLIGDLTARAALTGASINSRVILEVERGFLKRI